MKAGVTGWGQCGAGWGELIVSSDLHMSSLTSVLRHAGIEMSGARRKPGPGHWSVGLPWVEGVGAMEMSSGAPWGLRKEGGSPGIKGHGQEREAARNSRRNGKM